MGKNISTTAEIRKLGDLPNVHIKEVHNKVTGRVIEYHPRREWIGYGGNPNSHVIEQDGSWWNSKGKRIPESQVPEEVLATAKANPKVITTQGPQVSHTCEHCNQPFLGDAYEQHLLEVVREMTGGATASEVAGLDG
jgi:hypothetical protein